MTISFSRSYLLTLVSHLRSIFNYLKKLQTLGLVEDFLRLYDGMRDS